jgi:hypothetical protein
MLYKKYDIQLSEAFLPENYPEMVSELAVMNKQIQSYPIYYKENIVISYFKDHSLNKDWIEANVKLAKMVTSNTMKSSHMESLFEACRKNKSFLIDFESYIKKEILKQGIN